MNGSYIKYLAGLLLFGFNGIVASHIALNSYEIVFFRTLIGGAFLVLVYLLSRKPWAALRDWKQLCYIGLSGLAMGGNWLFLYEGYRQIGVSLSTLGCYFGPVLVMAVSPLVFRERLSVSRAVGVLLAFGGMILVDGQELLETGPTWGLACGLGAAVMYLVMVIANKKADQVKGMENAAWQLIFSFGLVTVDLLLRRDLPFAVPAGSWPAILLLCLVNTGIGCWLYFSSVSELPAQSVAICGYLEPLSALVCSALFLGETLAPAQLLGAVLILGGAAGGEYFSHRREP